MEAKRMPKNCLWMSQSPVQYVYSVRCGSKCSAFCMVVKIKEIVCFGIYFYICNRNYLIEIRNILLKSREYTQSISNIYRCQQTSLGKQLYVIQFHEWKPKNQIAHFANFLITLSFTIKMYRPFHNWSSFCRK